MQDPTGQAENQPIPTAPAVATTATQTDSPPAKPFPVGEYPGLDLGDSSDGPPGWMSKGAPTPNPQEPPPVEQAQETPPQEAAPQTETPPTPQEQTAQPAAETEPAPDQQADETTGEVKEQPGDLQTLVSFLKGETPPEKTEPETPDTELPWHKRLSDEELERAKGQIVFNDDGTVQVPQININKAGEQETHLKTYATVNEALEALMKAPLTARRAIYDAQYAQEQLEKLRDGATQPVTPPEAPGSVETGTTIPVIPDLEVFGGGNGQQQQGAQTEQSAQQPTFTTATPQAAPVSLQNRLYQQSYGEVLKQMEEPAYQQFRQEREAEIRLERDIDEGEPVPWSRKDESQTRRDAREWVKEEANDSPAFQQKVQMQLAQYQNSYTTYWNREQAQAHTAFGQQAKDLLAPMLDYRNRVEVGGQPPQGEDEATLHRIMTDMDGSPNFTMMGSLVLNHLALRRALPQIKEEARKEGERAVLEKIELFRSQQMAARKPPAPTATQQVDESRTGAITAPPGFSDQTVPVDSLVGTITQPDLPEWIRPPKV